MKQGTITEKGGVYCCLYHLKNKIKVSKGSILPTCNFAGLNCVGEWHLLKEIKEKTKEELDELREKRRRAADKRRTFGNSVVRKLKDEKPGRWWDDKW